MASAIDRISASSMRKRKVSHEFQPRAGCRAVGVSCATRRPDGVEHGGQIRSEADGVGGLQADGIGDPALKQFWAEQDAELVGSTPDEFAAFVKAERDRWAPIVEKSGAREN